MNLESRNAQQQWLKKCHYLNIHPLIVWMIYFPTWRSMYVSIFEFRYALMSVWPDKCTRLRTCRTPGPTKYTHSRAKQSFLRDACTDRLEDKDEWLVVMKYKQKHKTYLMKTSGTEYFHFCYHYLLNSYTLTSIQAIILWTHKRKLYRYTVTPHRSLCLPALVNKFRVREQVYT